MARQPPEHLNNTPIIRIASLRKNFGDTAAVSDLNLEIMRGELFGLVGPDGAGKTTTMRMMAGIMAPTSGDIWVDGISVVDDPEAVKEHLAYMPQRFGLYQDLTVIENLIFYADLFRVPQKERSDRIDLLMGFSRLGPFKHRLAGALSGGMKQKLGLACALIHSPSLLLLDEPTNGVDPVSRRDFWKILYDLLKQGISIVVTTAYLDEAERTTRVGLMSGGSIIQLGTPHSLRKLIVGEMFELVLSDLAGARAALSRLPIILDANVFGNSLHVRVREKRQIEVITETLGTEEIEVYSLKAIEPSMEDVFLSLIPSRHGRDEPSLGENLAEQ
jgi:ABC-2 type transport system ATP-binding protein